MIRRGVVFSWACACALALVLSSCGPAEGEPPSAPGGSGAEGGSGGEPIGTGGTGGVGGEGGAGGTGGSGGGDRPVVYGFEPPGGTGRGFRLRVVGKNFARLASENSVLFAAREGAEVPTLQSVGLSADPEGGWFEVDVPWQAHSGPTRVLSRGVTLEGPYFTVTDDALPPSVTRVSPEVITQAEGEVRLTIEGKNFYVGRTVVYLGDAELEVDESASSSTTLAAIVPAAIANVPGTYQLRVETPPPGGGKSALVPISVVEALRLVGVRAVAPDRLIVQFNRAVARNPASDPDNFQIEGVPNAVWSASRRMSNPAEVELRLRAGLESGQTYVLVVSTKVVAQDGATLANTKMEFVAWKPELQLLGAFGGYDCGNDGFADPTGVVLAQGSVYVVEREGNQVQVVGLDGDLLGFFGHDGTAFGFHEEGEATGCGGGGPTPGLLAPVGGVGVTTSGEVFVADSGNGRILELQSEGARVVVEGLEAPTALLGVIAGRGLAVTHGPGTIATYDAATGALTWSYGGAPGSGRGQLDFRMDEGGVPALARMEGGFSDYILLVEPGNHRVSRFTAGSFEARGSIGRGAGDFFDDATGEAGTDPGSFTGPAGIAIDSDRGIFVVDSQGGASGGGRLQRFTSSGVFQWSVDLGYVPGGLAIDPSQRHLWISNRTEHKLMKYAY